MTKLWTARLGVALMICAVAPSVADAKSYSLEPKAGEGQQLRWEQGIGTITSDMPAGQVWLKPVAKTFDKRMVFSVSVANKSAAPVEIGYESVQATTPEGLPLELVTLERMEKEAKTKAAWATFAVALAGGLAAASSTNYTSGSIYGPHGSTTFTMRSYDPVAAQMAADNTAANLQNIQAGLGGKLADLEHNLLQRNTIDPGQGGGGFVVVAKPPKGSTAVKVTVNFAGEAHDFLFAVAN